jgi:zinc transporter ZupT
VGASPWKFAAQDAQPNRGVVRLNGVIANLIHRPDRHVALDLLLRLAAAALVTIAILGLLPAIAEVAS